MSHPSHAYLPLSCEEGLPSSMFLSGGRLTTFLDFETATFCLICIEVVSYSDKLTAKNYKSYPCFQIFRREWCRNGLWASGVTR